MHRHGYKGKKFNRERDQRSALIAGLADSLVKYESIETTLTKAKELVPYVEKLITKAKTGNLHNRRQIIKGLQTLESAHKLVDEIAPKLNGRNSGHLQIKRTILRRGDHAQLANVIFVDDLNVEVKTASKSAVKKPAISTASATKKAVKKASAKKGDGK